jgi:uncharacterized protein with HEPN domain
MTNDESRLRLADYLSHMMEGVRLAREYVAGISKDDFLKDRRTQQAVVLNLITISEAASRIVTEHKGFAAGHPEIPWAQCAQYYGVFGFVLLLPLAAGLWLLMSWARYFRCLFSGP